MMQIHVLLFGVATDLVGKSSFDLSVAPDITVAQFKDILTVEYPEMEKLNAYAIAVNENYASDETALRNQDVIAVIPPVSGG